MILKQYVNTMFGLRSLSLFLLFTISASALTAAEIKAPKFSRSIADFSVIAAQSSLTDFENVENVERSSGADIFQRVFPSVVKVLTNSGQGSGVVLTNDTQLILTNYHVIEGYSSVGLVFANDAATAQVSIADVIKVDQIKDLALLQLNGVRPDLIPLNIADKQPLIGEDVHAVGHPLGEDWTYTRGYISQIRNNYSWSTDIDEHHVANVIQTQTPINPGNSGGPLVNNNAELVGINTFGNTNAQGLNYSVAISSVLEFFRADGDTLRTAMPRESNTFGKMVHSIDENGNGNPDFYAFDYNLNSQPDTYVVDTNEDLLAEIVLFDENENDVIELKVEFVQFEGEEIAIYLMDENEDEIFETRGIDANLDGKLDLVEPID